MKLAYHRLAAKGLMLLGGLMLTPIYARQVTNATDTCAAVEECSNLEGDCCPSQNGFDLFCCNANEGSCLSNSGCLEANLTGECCPTIDNVFLDCCDRPFASCDAHPKCDHLAGDCCPTTSGVFLDCCLDDQSLDNITFPPNEAAAQCANNEQCVGLADACCPTIDGVYLYCCGEQPRSSGYQVLSTLVSPSVPEPFQLAYLVSSSPYVIGSSAPTGGTPPGPTSVIYERNSTELFDLVYYRANNTGVIGSASDFVSGSKKFYMHIWTDAPACTQILLQLDNLPLATPDNFPIGRHSRYISFTTKEQEWERIEFDFLDLLDEQLAADQINALALFFDPGSTNSYTYYFDFLDITEDGCVDSVDCEVPSIKNCPAYFGGEDEDDGPISNVGPPTSASPSSQPSASPSSHVPSASPSSSPSSNMPSLSPSSSPSTSAPSSLPSSFPSTEFPSTLPSLDPSAHPSELPSTMPSLHPSESPSTMPSLHPSTVPTGVPTAVSGVIPDSPPPYLWDAPTCADGIDNDGDGYNDCADPDCCLTIQCWNGWRRSYSTATSQLTVDGSSQQEDPTSASASRFPHQTFWMSLVATWTVTFAWFLF